jgi:hypothetical protein
MFENIIQLSKYRRMGWAEHVTHMGERRVVCRIMVGKREGKRPPGISRRRWENNNKKMEIQEVGCGRVDCIDLAQDRDRRRALVNAVTTLRVP